MSFLPDPTTGDPPKQFPGGLSKEFILSQEDVEWTIAVEDGQGPSRRTKVVEEYNRFDHGRGTLREYHFLGGATESPLVDWIRKS